MVKFLALRNRAAQLLPQPHMGAPPGGWGVRGEEVAVAERVRCPQPQPAAITDEDLLAEPRHRWADLGPGLSHE